MTQSRIRHGFESGVRVAAILLLFLAPLKFGNIVGNGEISLFPPGLFDWLFGPWPPFLFAVLAGLLLLATVLASPPPSVSGWAWAVPGVWLLLTAGACMGLLKTTEWEYALLFLRHLLGVSCLALAFFWLFPRADRRWRNAALTAVAAGVLWTAIDGWAQTPGGGLKRFAKTVERQAQTQGEKLPADMISRLHQTRAFATFTYPNSFAAHLLVAGPLALLLLWRAGGRFEPVRLSRRLFLGVGLALVAGALWFTGSRAAMLALGGGIALGALYRPGLRRWRIPIIVAAVLFALLAGSVLTFMRSGRKLSSIESRMGYYRAALVMFRGQPVTGVGLGEFFPHYLQMKSAKAEEARQPHSLLLNFLAQAGLPGGGAAILFLALPLYLPLLLRRGGLRSDSGLLTVTQVGLAAWCLHTLTDFDVLIPGTLATAAVLPILCFDGGDTAAPGAPAPAPPAFLARLAGLVLAIAAITGLHRVPGEIAYGRLAAAAGHPDVSLPVVRDLAAAAAHGLPLNPHPWMVLGRVAEERSLWTVAAEAYRQAVLRTPHRAAFHRHYANALFEIGEKEAARHQALLALEWYPADPEIRVLLRRLDQDNAVDRPAAPE